MASVIPPSVIVPLTYPKFVGWFLTVMLYGFLCSHTWTYFRHFPKDRTRIKLLVSYLLIVQTVQVAMNIHDALIVFGNHFGDIDELKQVNLQWFYIPILTVMASCPVQLFYAHRMTLFSRTYLTRAIATVVVMLAFLATIASIINGVKSVQNAKADKPLYEELWLGSSSICDTIITATMITLLQRSDPQNKQTKQVVSKLTQLLIENGFITAVLTVGDLGVMLKFPEQLYHFPICAICASLHSVTLLIYLNSRTYLTISTSSKTAWDVVQHTIQFAPADESGTYQSHSSALSPGALREMHWSTRSDLCPDVPNAV
ncbi:hypothetical protein GYMLUDRAFT_220897 [Collybiopsis luxurians FD-317 M1]|nr:hypothetical protein GYMLUDRAFT_220897 [Collybiopsis luxurians FD-317 M1]